MKKFLKAASTVVGLALVSAVAQAAIKRFQLGEKIVDAAVTGYAKVTKQAPADRLTQPSVMPDGTYR